MGSQGGRGAPVPQIVTPSPPRRLSSLVAFAPREPSRHNPVRLLMFTCMFNDCTRITTHRSMSALFLYLFLYIYFFGAVFPLLYKLAASFTEQEASDGVLTSIRQLAGGVENVLGWRLLLHPPVCPLLW